MGFGRLPNGIGTITKLKQRLRKPYRARKLVGEVLDEQTMKVRRIYRTVGYYENRKDALDALMADGCVSTQDLPLTFKNVFDQWSARHFQTVSRRSATNYTHAFRQFEVLNDRAFRDLKAADYETAAKDTPPSVNKLCKVLLSQLYQYAIRNEIVEKDYSKLVRLDTKTEKKEKRPFSPDEVKRLWDMPSDTLRNIVLIGIYSGFRPQELLELDTADITDGCFVGGMKTENGKNRLVPIHPIILPLVETERLKSANFESTRLFSNTRGRKFSYQDFLYWFKPRFPDHTPHEMRHSFATYARRSGMDATIIKRIMGHSLKDLTEEVYTHVDADILIAEMQKYEVK